MGANFFMPGNSIPGNFELDGFECVTFGVPSLFRFFSFFAESAGDTVAGVCFSSFSFLGFLAAGGVSGAHAGASVFGGEAAGAFLFFSGWGNVRPIFAASSSSKLSPSVNEEFWLSSEPTEGPGVVDEVDVDGWGVCGAASATGGGAGRGSGAGGGTYCGRASGAGAPPCGAI
jgi:hypothetical protein